jgi:competence protein ComEC
MLYGMKSHPAFVLGCLLLVVTGFYFHPHWSYGFAVIALAASFFIREKKLLYFCGFALIFYLYLTAFFPLQELEKPVQGLGQFEIHSLKIVESPFNRSFLYRGRLKTFESDEGKTWKNLPCSIYVDLHSERSQANQNYLISGRLSQKGPHQFVLKPQKKVSWQKIEGSFSFAEWRYKAKEQVQKFIHTQIPQEKVAAFFTALITGNLEDRILASDFAKAGLQHILCISGFHFALFAAFLGGLLRLFFPLKITAVLLLLFLSAYFFLIGDAPSVMRAWVAISLFLISRIFQLNTNALNALGAGLCFEILYNPLCITSVGFQLSFLCTWAILTLYPLSKKLTHLVLPKRPLQQVAKMNLINQHGYLGASLIREAVALNLAVHFASFPVILYLFHKFPLQSLIYNLFFPFLFGLSLLFHLVALLCTFLIPPLGSLLHGINSSFTSLFLEITANPVPFLDFTIRIKHFPFSLLIAILSLTFFAVNHLRRDRCENI